jgi:hypothetical protein
MIALHVVKSSDLYLTELLDATNPSRALLSRLVASVPNFILSFTILALVKNFHPPPPLLLRAEQTNGEEPRLLSW